MFLILSVIRPEKLQDVTEALAAIGVQGMTKVPAIGRGKQNGLVVGDISYKDIPKEMMQIIVEKSLKDEVVQTIMKSGRTGEGNHGDGRVFVIPVVEAYTISTGLEGP